MTSVWCRSTGPLTTRCAVTRSTKSAREMCCDVADTSACSRKTSCATSAHASAYHAGSTQKPPSAIFTQRLRAPDGGDDAPLLAAEGPAPPALPPPSATAGARRAAATKSAASADASSAPSTASSAFFLPCAEVMSTTMRSARLLWRSARVAPLRSVTCSSAAPRWLASSRRATSFVPRMATQCRRCSLGSLSAASTVSTSNRRDRNSTRTPCPPPPTSCARLASARASSSRYRPTLSMAFSLSSPGCLVARPSVPSRRKKAGSTSGPHRCAVSSSRWSTATCTCAEEVAMRAPLPRLHKSYKFLRLGICHAPRLA